MCKTIRAALLALLCIAGLSVSGNSVIHAQTDPAAIDRRELVMVASRPGASVAAGELLSALGRAEHVPALDVPELGVSVYWTPGRAAVLPPAVAAVRGVAWASKVAVWQIPSSEMSYRERAEPAVAAAIGAPDREPFWSLLWNLLAIGDVRDAWSAATGAGVLVGVIDLAIDCSHVDVRCTHRTNHYDAIRRIELYDSIARNDAVHGTHVAGIIAGAHNGRGIIGVAPEAEVLGCRACSDGGTCSELDVMACVTYLAPRGVQVINMSLGGGYGPVTPGLCESLSWAAGQHDVLSVASVGNNGPSASPLYPASCGGVLGVAASIGPDGDRLADYSQRAGVDITAPGSEVLSSIPGGRWAYLSGTSMAAPHVAGAAALLAETMGDQWSPSEAARILTEYARRICGPVYQPRLCGWGALDVSAAVRAVMPAPPDEDTPTPWWETPEGTATVEPTPTVPPTATHIPPVQTLIAGLTQTAAPPETATQAPTPSGTPEPTQRPTTTRTPTEALPPTATATITPTIDPVALTVTALWPTATPDVPGTMTAIAPTPDRVATAVWATLRAPGAAETRAASRRRLYLPGLLGPSPATATPEPTDDACERGQPWECPAKTREAQAANEMATIVAATAQAHATFWAGQTPMPTPIPTRDWPLAAPRARLHDREGS